MFHHDTIYKMASNREVTPEAIKNRFVSFLPSSFKSESGIKPLHAFNILASSKFKEVDKDQHEKITETERKITDPRDKDGYFNRVKTFTVFTWFAKPKDLSPLECARYGWQNIDVDMLECVSCKAKLCGQLPETQDLEVYPEFYRKLKENLKNSHEKCCSWSSYPSPALFKVIDFFDKREVMNEFYSRLKGFQAIKSDLPRLSCKTFKEKGVDEDRLRNLVTEFQHDLNTQDKRDMPSDVIEVSLLLSVCGWRIGEKSSAILSCNYCKRHVGLWNYKKVDLECSNAKQDCASNENKTSEEQDRVSPENKNWEEQVDTSSKSPKNQNNQEQVDTSSKSPENQNNEEQVDTFSKSHENKTNEEQVDTSSKSPENRSVEEKVDSFSGSLKNKSVEEQVDSSSKRLKMEEKESFDPIEEHRYWCPWIMDNCIKTSDVSVSPQKESANQNYCLNSQPHNVTNYAWMQMLKLVFPTVFGSDSQEATITQYFKQKSPVQGLRKIRSLLNAWSSPSVPYTKDKS